jgi:DNA-directed RNA polymerase specialized sigma24 family protein
MNEANNITKRELGEILHHRHINGDPTATARIAELFYETILYRLQKRHAKKYHDLVANAVQDAFMNYFKRPEQYNPDKAKLEAYLYMSANGDFRNLLDKERRYLRKIDESVELDTDKAEYVTEVAEKNVKINTGIKESSFLYWS